MTMEEGFSLERLIILDCLLLAALQIGDLENLSVGAENCHDVTLIEFEHPEGYEFRRVLIW